MTTDTNRLSPALVTWQAWWEGQDMWDGNALYIDLETAKVHAAYDYEGDEYGHPDEGDDEEEPRSRPEFTWVEEHGSWHLLDHGSNTLVQVSRATVWRPSTEREVKQQDALAAAEEAERATRPQRPLAEELERLAGTRTVAP